MAEEKSAADAQGVATETKEVSQFEQFLEKDIKTAGTRDAVRAEVQTLAEWALKFTTIVSEDALRSIEAIKAQIDKILTEQVNAIIHHPSSRSSRGHGAGWPTWSTTPRRREAQDQGHERLEEGARQDPREIRGHGLGPEPHLQRGL